MRAVFGTFALTAVLSLIATPLFRLLALRLGLVDHPDGRRKLHDRVIAVSGGVPVFLTVVIGIVATLVIPNRWQSILLADPAFLLSLLAAAGLIIAVGVLDDWKGIRGRQKLLGQILAALLVVVAGGLRIDRIEVFHAEPLELGLLAVPFTMFWLLGAINAFNLVDGVDGLASSLGLIISLGLAGMAVMFGHGAYGLIPVALAGSLAGFLVYNFPPARIFLGDAGSMLIGLLLGTLAIRCSLKGPATAALVVPTAIMTLPILDVSMAILRRKLTGKSLYETDRGHLHHCLIAKGFSGRQLLLSAGILASITAIGAMISLTLKNDYVAVMSAALVVLVLIVTRSFGHTELYLVAKRLRSLASSFVPSAKLADSGVQRLDTSHLRGSIAWDDLWESLTDFADEHDLECVELNVSVPALDEEYHAKWLRRHESQEVPPWRTDIPLTSDGMAVGRLRLAGLPVQGTSVCDWIGELTMALRPIEAQIRELVAARVAAPAQGSGSNGQYAVAGNLG